MNVPHRNIARRFAGAAALLAAALCGGAARAQRAYTSSFTSGAGPEWSSARTESTPGATKFLGRFGNESVRLSLAALPAHSYATITFDVYALLGWDGAGAENGPDMFTVGVPGGLTLVQTSFSNGASRQSYPEACPFSDYAARSGAYRSNTLGYASPGDATYRITRTFPHSGETLDVDFAAQGLAGDAAWGLNSVQVKLTTPSPNSTLSNGDFESPTLSSNVTYATASTIYGWTVASGNVMMRRGSHCPSGEQYLDLSGSLQGAVQQDVPVLPGQQYDLRFWLAGNPSTAPAVKQVRVLWGTDVIDTLTFDTAGHSLLDPGWEPHHYLVTAPASGSTARLSFQALTAGAGGPFLDRISVTPTVPGDVNDDGVADLQDAIATLRLLAGVDAGDAPIRARADVHPYAGSPGRPHGDGAITVGDVQTALKLAAGGVSYLDMAQSAVNDLYAHFWVGSATTGHVLPTWGGQYNTDFPNGSMWEHAQMLRTMMDLYRVTGDPALKTRIASDWAWTVSKQGSSGLTRVGAGTNMNWSDDAGWSMLMYLDVYRITGSSNALTYAQTLFNNSYNRWADDTYGGGLWYTDEHLQKAVYQVSQILAGLRIYDLTGVASYRDKSILLYNWVVSHLARGNGLYYVDYNANGPAKNNAPPRQASSDTMLAGNMAMAVTAARLYRATGSTVYLNRAINTANAILAVENDGGGVLMNDRDANVDGFYAGDWAAEVLTLPGIGPEHADMLRRTAASITGAARTPDGYYSGNWSGPAQGPLAAWASGFMPQQIVVSSNSVHMIVGAAGIGVLQPEPARAF